MRRGCSYPITGQCSIDPSENKKKLGSSCRLRPFFQENKKKKEGDDNAPEGEKTKSPPGKVWGKPSPMGLTVRGRKKK